MSQSNNQSINAEISVFLSHRCLYFILCPLYCLFRRHHLSREEVGNCHRSWTNNINMYIHNMYFIGHSFMHLSHSLLLSPRCLLFRSLRISRSLSLSLYVHYLYSQVEVLGMSIPLAETHWMWMSGLESDLHCQELLQIVKHIGEFLYIIQLCFQKKFKKITASILPPPPAPHWLLCLINKEEITTNVLKFIVNSKNEGVYFWI